MKDFVLDFEKPIHELEDKINELEELAQNGKLGLDSEIKRLRKKADKLHHDVYTNLTRWQCVQIARHPNRPYSSDYIERIAPDFVELHGDRLFSDDKAIIAGIGTIESIRVAIVSQQKGRGTKENLKRNFGMPHPEGYRKAMRIMKLAEKFHLPVITLIDTPGAYPGLGAEERGQACAIATNLYEMAGLTVPIIAVVLGEGGSGGALALGVADHVHMLRFSIYSVISPEGCASILFRDASHAQQAAEAMKITSLDMKKAGLVDSVIGEPLGGAHNDHQRVAVEVKKTVLASLEELMKLSPDVLLERRIEKFNQMGVWQD